MIATYIYNAKKKIIDENFEKIYKNFKLIRETYNDQFKFDRLNELIHMKMVIQKKLIEVISNIKGKYYFEIEVDNIYEIFNEFNDIVVEAEKIVGKPIVGDGIEITKKLIKDSICLFDELLNKIKDNKNIDNLYNNYSTIDKFVKSNFNDGYELSECEKSDIINYLKCDPSINYWGKKDIVKKGIENGYNDQFIWYEIVRFSKETKNSVVLLTNDKKDFKNSNLKEAMMEYFHNETGQHIRIIGLNEYDEMKFIKEKEKIKDMFEKFAENEFIKIKDVDSVINEAIDFIENNSDMFSEYLQDNKDSFDGLFDESFEDYEYGEEYILAVNALESEKENYVDFEDLGVNLYIKFNSVINEHQIVCNIIVT